MTQLDSSGVSAVPSALAAALVASLDIDAYQNLQVLEVTLKHPVTGVDTPAKITIAGPEHPDRKAMMFARARIMRAEFQRTGKVANFDPADDFVTETEFIAKCTLGWSGMSRGGLPLTFTPEEALALYSDPRRQWIRAQIKAALDTAELFIGDSSKP
jgi:hypothetical protein